MDLVRYRYASAWFPPALSFPLIDDGVELVYGDVERTGELAASDAIERNTVVRVLRPGDYEIAGPFEGRTRDGTSVSDYQTWRLVVQE